MIIRTGTVLTGGGYIKACLYAALRQCAIHRSASLRFRYRKLSPDQLDSSRAESLKDAAERIMPFYNSVVVPSMRSGNKCIIVSHANTIRTLIKNIDGISDEDIKGMSIPTGIPLLYRLDKNMKPVDPQIELEFRYMVEPKGCVEGSHRIALQA
jgi:2,3-bisphosphoglycerate-dependent phosphoglycerate mutase